MKNSIFILTSLVSIFLVSCNSKPAQQKIVSGKETATVKEPQERKACCENPNSKDCKPDGTCKPKSVDCKPGEKDAAKCSEKKENCCKEGEAKSKEGPKACCAMPNEKASAVLPVSTAAAKQNRLEVYCFHGTRQCETCINMKANTKATLNKYFAEQLKNGTLVFAIVDVDVADNEKLAEKFQATGTALMINNVVNGKDNIADWSDFAFEKANDADKFIPELKAKIELVLSK